MKIKALSLYTNKLEQEQLFYSEILGFKIIDRTRASFTVKIGWSKLTFLKSDKSFKYHYCFLIPSNKFEEALEWMETKTTVLDIENGRKTQRFESWNADSFYFYDASGNIAECIVRHDLNNNIQHTFGIEDVICVNEIGVPTASIENTNSIIAKKLNSFFWKGNKTHFGTNGTQEGLFLLPNYETRKKWFPTNVTVVPSPFKAVVENNNMVYNFEFKDEDIIIKQS